MLHCGRSARRMDVVAVGKSEHGGKNELGIRRHRRRRRRRKRQRKKSETRHGESTVVLESCKREEKKRRLLGTRLCVGR